MATKQDMSDRKDAMLGGWDTAVLVTAQRLARFAYDGQEPAWSELNELIEPHLSSHSFRDSPRLLFPSRAWQW